jgi:hypothetical protein
MKNNYSKYILLVLFVILAGVTQNVSAQKTTVATGVWSDAANWSPAGVPTATDNVFIEAGHTITVDGNFACANLNISTTGVLAVGANVLMVNGKLRSYTGVAPGVSTSSPGATSITNTSGKTVFTFADSIVKVGEWGATAHSWRAEFAIAGAGVGSIGGNFKAGDIIISNGTLSTSNDIRPDNNSANTGSLTINTGARLRFTGGGNIRRTGTAGTPCASVTVDGTLEYNSSTGGLFAVTRNINGTVAYTRGSSQFLSGQISTYKDLILGGTGDKTDTVAITIQNNGTVSLLGSASAVFKTATGTVNSGSISYGTNTTLIVASTSGFYNLNGYADFFHIWPATNGPTNVSVTANTFRLNSPTFDRTITGALTLNGGNLIVRDTASLRFANNAAIVRNNGTIRTSASTTPGLTGTIFHGLSAGDKVNLVMGYSDTARSEFPGNAGIAPGSIGSLTINNGVDYVLANVNRTVDNLIFNSGKIILVDDTLTVNNTITGASSSNYIVTDAPAEALRMSVGSSAKLFPVGPSISLYHPATITNSGTPDNFSVNVKSEKPACADPAYAVNATWDIGEEIAGGSNCTLSLDYGGLTPASPYNPATAKIVHCTGTTADYADGSVTGTVATGTGFTIFSPFGVRSDAVVPISLVNFSGKANKTGNDLHWNTANEQNNKGFEIQRSTDGVNFAPIAFVNSLADNGYSSINLNYTYTDSKVQAGKVFYRLKQVDYNQTAKMSEIISLYTELADNLAISRLVANSSKLAFVVNAPAAQKLSFVVYDASGKVVASKNTAVTIGINSLEIDIANCPSGVYLLQIGGNSKFVTTRFIK